MSRDALILIIIRIMVQFQFSVGADTQYSDDSQTEILHPCGQYGFRCIDRTSYQVCAIDLPDDDFYDSYKITPEPEPIYECKDGLICDEDNPAFCTALDIPDAIYTTKSSNNHPKEILALNKHNYENDYYKNDDHINDDYDDRDDDNDDDYYYEFNDVNRPERHSRLESKYDSFDYIDNEDFDTYSTTEQITESIDFTTMIFTTEPAFDCDSYGYFPDHDGKNTFWFCDVPENGQGFLLRHMVCIGNRIYDPIRRTCIIPGTTRQKEYDLSDLNLRSRRNNSENLNEKFSCDNKTPGKYPDDSNCLNYYFCVPNMLLPIKDVLFTCPENTAYDLNSKKCSPQAYHSCIEGLQAYHHNGDNNNWSNSNKLIKNQKTKKSKFSSNLNCITPSRSRDIRDCNRYYLCYGDQVYEIQCPDSYKFDDDTMKCLPQRIAKCSEILD